MIQVFYSSGYVMSEYAFDTTRKAQWIADSLTTDPIPGLRLVEPTLLPHDAITAVHSPEYVRAIETGRPRGLAESQGFDWDARLWPMVLTSCGGMVAAAHAALNEGVAGSLSSGFHHASYGSGCGFCTFNGLVIAAKAALTAGAQNVLILDLDAHCGGGTASLIADETRIWQFGVSVCEYDWYPETERARLTVATDGFKYLATVRQTLQEIESLGAFSLCLYNAGMDPCTDSGGPFGITPDVLAERERMVFSWCAAHRIPIAFALAGGYIGSDLDQAGLVALHRLTLHAACSAQ
jgi:acetoin utilization deacetylase AcuC-like enzyme